MNGRFKKNIQGLYFVFIEIQNTKINFKKLNILMIVVTFTKILHYSQKKYEQNDRSRSGSFTWWFTKELVVSLIDNFCS